MIEKLGEVIVLADKVIEVVGEYIQNSENIVEGINGATTALSYVDESLQISSWLTIINNSEEEPYTVMDRIEDDKIRTAVIDAYDELQKMKIDVKVDLK